MEIKIRNAAEKDLTELLQYDRHIAVEKLMECVWQGNVYAICLEHEIIGVLRYSFFGRAFRFWS